MDPRHIITGLTGIFLYTFREEIKEMIMYFISHVVESYTNKLIINGRAAGKITYAIKEELTEKLNKRMKKFSVTDGAINPHYKICNGSYTLIYNNITVYVNITDDNIEITSYWGTTDTLKTFLNSICEKYSTTENVLLFYILDKQSWNHPIYRRPRIINNITNSMTKFLNDIDDFLTAKTEDSYEQNGMPYRKGYLIKGAAGTGKSTVCELIAIKHNMSIYVVNLNSEGMTDSVLINLIATVPTRSVIVFDEMDKQYETAMKNRFVQLSAGGILNAIDGAQRMSHGTIVVMIVNDIKKIRTDLTIPLLRKGRIDETFEFKEIL